MLIKLLIGVALLVYNTSTAFPAQTHEENDEHDGDSSRKIIGSSVVTSVSVVMNGKNPEFTDAIGKPIPRPLVPPQVASPINLLNPDRYEFYTFDDNGDLIKRLMTMKEIQSIVAGGDSDGVMMSMQSSIGQSIRDPQTNVQDIVNSVQSVLEKEILLKKNTSHIPPAFLDTPDVSSSWSMILPAVFGNTGGEISPQKPQQINMTPETDVVYNKATTSKPSTPSKNKITFEKIGTVTKVKQNSTNTNLNKDNIRPLINRKPALSQTTTKLKTKVTPTITKIQATTPRVNTKIKPVIVENDYLEDTKDLPIKQHTLGSVSSVPSTIKIESTTKKLISESPVTSTSTTTTEVPSTSTTTTSPKPTTTSTTTTTSTSTTTTTTTEATTTTQAVKTTKEPTTTEVPSTTILITTKAQSTTIPTTPSTTTTTTTTTELPTTIAPTSPKTTTTSTTSQPTTTKIPTTTESTTVSTTQSTTTTEIPITKPSTSTVSTSTVKITEEQNKTEASANDDTDPVKTIEEIASPVKIIIFSDLQINDEDRLPELLPTTTELTAEEQDVIDLEKQETDYSISQIIESLQDNPVTDQLGLEFNNNPNKLNNQTDDYDQQGTTEFIWTTQNEDENLTTMPITAKLDENSNEKETTIMPDNDDMEKVTLASDVNSRIDPSNVFQDNQLFVDEKEPILIDVPTTTDLPISTSDEDIFPTVIPVALKLTNLENYNINRKEGIVEMVDRFIAENANTTSEILKVGTDFSLKTVPLHYNMPMNEYIGQAATVASILSDIEVTTQATNIEPETETEPTEFIMDDIEDSLTNVISQISESLPSLINFDKHTPKDSDEDNDDQQALATEYKIPINKFSSLESLSLVKHPEITADNIDKEIKDVVKITLNNGNNDNITYETSIVKETSSVSVATGLPQADTKIVEVATTTDKDVSTLSTTDEKEITTENTSATDDKPGTEKTEVITEEPNKNPISTTQSDMVEIETTKESEIKNNNDEKSDEAESSEMTTSIDEVTDKIEVTTENDVNIKLSHDKKEEYDLESTKYKSDLLDDELQGDNDASIKYGDQNLYPDFSAITADILGSIGSLDEDTLIQNTLTQIGLNHIGVHKTENNTATNEDVMNQTTIIIDADEKTTTEADVKTTTNIMEISTEINNTGEDKENETTEKEYLNDNVTSISSIEESKENEEDSMTTEKILELSQKNTTEKLILDEEIKQEEKKENTIKTSDVQENDISESETQTHKIKEDETTTWKPDDNSMSNENDDVDDDDDDNSIESDEFHNSTEFDNESDENTTAELLSDNEEITARSTTKQESTEENISEDSIEHSNESSDYTTTKTRDSSEENTSTNDSEYSSESLSNEYLNEGMTTFKETEKTTVATSVESDESKTTEFLDSNEEDSVENLTPSKLSLKSQDVNKYSDEESDEDSATPILLMLSDDNEEEYSSEETKLPKVQLQAENQLTSVQDSVENNESTTPLSILKNEETIKTASYENAEITTVNLLSEKESANDNDKENEDVASSTVLSKNDNEDKKATETATIMPLIQKVKQENDDNESDDDEETITPTLLMINTDEMENDDSVTPTLISQDQENSNTNLFKVTSDKILTTELPNADYEEVTPTLLVQNTDEEIHDIETQTLSALVQQKIDSPVQQKSNLTLLIEKEAVEENDREETATPILLDQNQEESTMSTVYFTNKDVKIISDGLDDSVTPTLLDENTTEEEKLITKMDVKRKEELDEEIEETATPMLLPLYDYENQDESTVTPVVLSQTLDLNDMNKNLTRVNNDSETSLQLTAPVMQKNENKDAIPDFVIKTAPIPLLFNDRNNQKPSQEKVSTEPSQSTEKDEEHFVKLGETTYTPEETTVNVAVTETSTSNLVGAHKVAALKISDDESDESSQENLNLENDAKVQSVLTSTQSLPVHGKKPFTSALAALKAQYPMLSTRKPVPINLIPAPKEALGLEQSTANLNDDLQEFSKLCNEIAFSFWKSINSKEVSSLRSLVVSPFAATSMLAMIFLGARGGTSGEMNEMLRLDDMVTFNPHLVFKNITDSTENLRESGVATSVFIRELFSERSKGKILPFYKEKVQQFYSGYIEESNFNIINDVVRRRTNLLVKRKTWGKVMEYLKTNNIWLRPPLAAMSANIFQTDCSKASTADRDGEMFFQVSPAIRQRRLVPIPAAVFRSGFTAGYDPQLDATVVAFGTSLNTVSTIFVMPGQQGHSAPGDNIERLENTFIEKAMVNNSWRRLLTTLMERPGLEVQIPRFSHRSIINATEGLQKMGLKDLFDSEKADLRGLTGAAHKDLFFSDMMQVNTFTTCGEGKIDDQHHIEYYPAPALRSRSSDISDIDETELQSDFEYVPENVKYRLVNEPRDYQRAFYDPLFDPKYLELPLPLRPRQARIPEAPRLRLDRPFLYFVRHNPTGLILYMGRFNPRLLP